MKELKIFENQEFGRIRTVEESGKILFCGSDVAKALGYAIPTKAINTHCKGVSKVEVPTNGGKQQMLFISEGDLYRLIVRSKLPSAEKFESWVFDEVLPQIRQTGQYSSQKKDSYMIEDPIERAKRWIEEQKEKLALQAENERMKPKALFADCVTASETSILVRDFAKILRQNGVMVGEKRLYNWFRENGYVIKGTCQPTQKSMEQGLFEVIERTISRGEKPPITTMTTKITGKGQIFFINKLVNESLAGTDEKALQRKEDKIG